MLIHIFQASDLKKERMKTKLKLWTRKNQKRKHFLKFWPYPSFSFKVKLGVIVQKCWFSVPLKYTFILPL